MTPATRTTLLRILRRELDLMETDRRAAPDYWYLKGDWRGDMRRKRRADELRAIRSAIRELKVDEWPAWYATEPTVAWSREGR